MTTIERIAAVVGREHCITDKAERELMSQDIFFWPDAVLAEAVVRPADTAQVAAVMKAAREAGLYVAPRGGGMSYTKGYVPERAGTIMLDLGRLNQIEEVNEQDLYIRVGAGCTWAQVREALQPRGLRTVISGPISGVVSTVGGGMAQNVPGSMDNVLGLEVVLADGRVIHTGSSGVTRTKSDFYRYYGPDLTGLFMGDTGAYGIKTKVTLRIQPIPAGAVFASFSFDTLKDMALAMAGVARLGVTNKSFGMDPLKNRTSTKVSLMEGAKTLGDVIRSGRSLTEGLRDSLRVVRAGRGVLDDVEWSLHLTIEGIDEVAAQYAAELARRVCLERGREIEPSVPIAMRARPFSIRGFLGLEGERWVPVHAMFPLSRVETAVDAVQAFFAARKDELDWHEIRYAFLSTINGPYWLIEPMFYWFDEISPLHRRHLDAQKIAKFVKAKPNPDARAVVQRIRAELRDAFFDIGAITSQIGKYYRLPEAMEPGAYQLLTEIKDLLDPDRRLNPGNLGWR
ncbi:MAG: FAD-binding oxidoreductase [Alphaproteobacteria bacterium]|nr:FAD-binding oxidoreductase [Alphaproteobacteria bacterium]